MSHLSVLMKRLDTNYGNPAPYVASIINYMKFFDDYTNEERDTALATLRKFGANPGPGEPEATLARFFGPTDLHKTSCIKCGRIMSVSSKMKRGMSMKCAEMVGDGVIPEVRGRLPEGFTGPPAKVNNSSFLSWKRRQKS